MSLFSIRNLGITLSSPLFRALDLTIQKGDRIGLIAANGRGKSTLFGCMIGRLEPSEGDLVRARRLTIGHVEQHLPPELARLGFHDAVRAALPADQAESESWRVDIVLDDLAVPELLRMRRLDELSGGWQRMALIARAWVTEPDLLLLDEPTNHLDLAGIARLENWLTGLPRETAVVIASHDRAFLDAVTDRSLFLRPEQSPCFALPYSQARAALDLADAADARREAQDQRKADQLRRQATKLKNVGINSGSDLLLSKTKQLQERAERIEEAAKPAHREASSGAVRLAHRGTHAQVLVTLDDAAVTAPDERPLFRTGKRYICQGDRIVLLGANGAGKTRLLSLIRAAIDRPAAQDAVRATPSLVLGYGDQALAEIDDAHTPLQAVTRRFDIGEQRARSVLAGAGIAVTMQERRVGALSGGQKARLGLLTLRLAQPNFYLLDEPTNHLDIEGQEALEGELLDERASCLLVSHDRSFVRAVGNRFWVIERGRLVEADSPEPFFAAMQGS